MKTIISFLILMLFSLVAFAQTNLPPADPSTADGALNWAVAWNNKLIGLPSGALVMIVFFFFDSVLYYAEFFRNRNIPVFSIVGGALIYFLMSWRVGADTLPAPIWVTKNIVFGCIFGTIAWIVSLRYGLKMIGGLAGRPDPSPPLPEKPSAPTKIELEITGDNPKPSVTVVAGQPPTPKAP